jgi:DNA repair and recombination protein RAD52
MTFTTEQIAELTAPLNREHVKSRTQGGSSVSYIEAYHAENEANRIFGFDAWDRETWPELIGEREHEGKWRVYYRAKVRITVRTPTGGKVIREGCGYGSGIDRDIGQAHESALKEAESDAEKRALKTFGNPFGQALYDKSQANVASAPPPPPALITDDQRDLIATLAQAAGVTLQKICETSRVPSLAQLPADQFEVVKKKLDLTIQQNKERKAAA